VEAPKKLLGVDVVVIAIPHALGMQ